MITTVSHANSLQPTLVRASAGTGKTYRLTARLLRILLQGAAPESILATTFTRKAAGEITARLLVDLAKAADEQNDQALDKLRQQLDLPSLPRSACLQLLDSLLRNIHRVRICTLDSLFSQLARSFPFELNLPPAWRLTDEIEEIWFRQRAVNAMIATLDHSEMLSVLSMLGKGEIKRSVAQELINVVGAAYTTGRGCNADVWNKLAVNKLPRSDQINEAIAALRAACPPQKSLLALINKMADALEHRDFESLENETLILNIHKARQSRSEVKFGRSKFPAGLDQAFDTLYLAARHSCLAHLRNQNRATESVLESYDHQIRQLKSAARAIGFDDVAYRLAAHFGALDHRTLEGPIDGAIDHILLDEFQDTSPVQWRVLRPLVQRVTDHVSDADTGIEAAAVDRSFFCVGDTKQAIYGWRGGAAEIFDAVANQLPGVVEDHLDTSYRSSQVVIDFVNQVFTHLCDHPKYRHAPPSDPTNPDTHAAEALRTFVRKFPLHKTARDELTGYVCIETAGPIIAGGPNDNFVRAASLAADIHRQANEKQIGILTRTNDGVGEVIRWLEQQRVDCSQEGGNPLTDSAAVELILSALMMSEHPGDGRWKFHTDNSPLSALPKFDAGMVRCLLTDRGLAETIELLAGSLVHVCDQRDATRLKQLVQLAINYQTNPQPRIRDFVQLVEQKRVERPQPAKIRVMTVHQAKGLEFDAVILPELEGPLTKIAGLCVAQVPEPGNPPAALSRYLGYPLWHFLSADWQQAFGTQVRQSMTESICLLYVAITRARQAVYAVISPASKEDFENKSAASLLYHSLPCSAKPNQQRQVLYQSGDPSWCL